MSKITIDDSRGVVEEEGSGLQINSSISMSSLPTVRVSLKTNPGNITRPGAYDLNYDFATTWIMPLASSVPGGVFVFRTSDGSPHNLTGSQETGGTKVFAGMAGTTPNNQGSKLTLETGTNKSVSLISDGRSFLVMAASGSCTISGI